MNTSPSPISFLLVGAGFLLWGAFPALLFWDEYWAGLPGPWVDFGAVCFGYGFLFAGGTLFFKKIIDRRWAGRFTLFKTEKQQSQPAAAADPGGSAAERGIPPH